MVTKDRQRDHNSEGEENTVDATLDVLLKKVSDLSAKAIEGFLGPGGETSREYNGNIVAGESGKIVGGVHMKIW